MGREQDGVIELAQMEKTGALKRAGNRIELL